jgi:hypothetical protein
VRRNARIAEKYWETVEAARKYFEVSSLFNWQWTECTR